MSKNWVFNYRCRIARRVDCARNQIWRISGRIEYINWSILVWFERKPSEKNSEKSWMGLLNPKTRINRKWKCWKFWEIFSDQKNLVLNRNFEFVYDSVLVIFSCWFQAQSIQFVILNTFDFHWQFDNFSRLAVEIIHRFLVESDYFAILNTFCFCDLFQVEAAKFLISHQHQINEKKSATVH